MTPLPGYWTSGLLGIGSSGRLGRLGPPGGSVEYLPDSVRTPGPEDTEIGGFGTGGLAREPVALLLCVGSEEFSFDDSREGRDCLVLFWLLGSDEPFVTFVPLLSLTSPSSTSAVVGFRPPGLNSGAEARSVVEPVDAVRCSSLASFG